VPGIAFPLKPLPGQQLGNRDGRYFQSRSDGRLFLIQRGSKDHHQPGAVVLLPMNRGQNFHATGLRISVGGRSGFLSRYQLSGRINQCHSVPECHPQPVQQMAKRSKRQTAFGSHTRDQLTLTVRTAGQQLLRSHPELPGVVDGQHHQPQAFGEPCDVGRQRAVVVLQFYRKSLDAGRGRQGQQRLHVPRHA
jgi:hypothetical protein